MIPEKIKLMHPDKIYLHYDGFLVLDGIDLDAHPLPYADTMLVYYRFKGVCIQQLVSREIIDHHREYVFSRIINMAKSIQNSSSQGDINQ